MRFFTNAKFGDLGRLGKALIDGETLIDAMEISGVRRHRAKRLLDFLISLKPDLAETARGKKIVKQRRTPRRIKKQKSPRVRIRYVNVCKICAHEFCAIDQRQCVCSPGCGKMYRKNFCRQYYREYLPRYRRLKKSEGSNYANRIGNTLA